MCRSLQTDVKSIVSALKEGPILNNNVKQKQNKGAFRDRLLAPDVLKRGSVSSVLLLSNL